MSRTFLVAVILLLFGLLSSLVLQSIAPNRALSQLFFVAVSLCVYVIASWIPAHAYQAFSPILFLSVCALLLYTLILGYAAKGATRWISIGSVRVQVSELAKPALVVATSLYAVSSGLSSQKKLAKLFGMSALIIAPVFLQPDLGSSLVLASIVAVVTFLCVRRFSSLVPWVGIALLGGIVIWSFLLLPYQKERIFSFQDRAPSTGSGYNAQQAQITLGSGKLLGRGLGHGVQTQLRFLPEYHTDFFFASYGEELGFVGVFALFLLYGSLYIALLYDYQRLDLTDKIIRASGTLCIFFQMCVHIGMNSGLLPVTGITLPFLSSGGSSFLSFSLLLGLMMAFSRKTTASSQGYFTKTSFPAIL